MLLLHTNYMLNSDYFNRWTLYIVDFFSLLVGQKVNPIPVTDLGGP
jgi:hypothetical protein